MPARSGADCGQGDNGAYGANEHAKNCIGIKLHSHMETGK